MTLRDELAADAHRAWMDRMIADGVATCPSNLTGEEQLVPFEQLSPAIQQYDYDLVDVILASLKRRDYIIFGPPEDGGERMPETDDFPVT